MSLGALSEEAHQALAIAMNKIYFKRILINATEHSNDPIYFPKTLQIKRGKKLSVENHQGQLKFYPESPSTYFRYL